MPYQRPLFAVTPIEAAAVKLPEEQGVFGELISVYTRRQAIEDGVLVDLCDPESDTADMVREAGWRVPVAMTYSAFHRYVWPLEEAEGAPLAAWLSDRGQDLRGRLWDILHMAYLAARRRPQDSTVAVRLHVVCCVEGERKGRRLVTLKAVMGGDDDGAPCLTIMLPEED